MFVVGNVYAISEEMLKNVFGSPFVKCIAVDETLGMGLFQRVDTETAEPKGEKFNLNLSAIQHFREVKPMCGACRKDGKFKATVYVDGVKTKLCPTCARKYKKTFPTCDCCGSYMTVPGEAVFDSSEHAHVATICTACARSARIGQHLDLKQEYIVKKCRSCGILIAGRAFQGVSTCPICLPFILPCADGCGAIVNTVYVDGIARLNFDNQPVCPDCFKSKYDPSRAVHDYSYRPSILKFEKPQERNQTSFRDFAARVVPNPRILLPKTRKRVDYKDYVRLHARPTYSAANVRRLLDQTMADF